MKHSHLFIYLLLTTIFSSRLVFSQDSVSSAKPWQLGVGAKMGLHDFHFASKEKAELINEFSSKKFRDNGPNLEISLRKGSFQLDMGLRLFRITGGEYIDRLWVNEKWDMLVGSVYRDSFKVRGALIPFRCGWVPQWKFAPFIKGGFTLKFNTVDEMERNGTHIHLVEREYHAHGYGYWTEVERVVTYSKRLIVTDKPGLRIGPNLDIGFAFSPWPGQRLELGVQYDRIWKTLDEFRINTFTPYFAYRIFAL